MMRKGLLLLLTLTLGWGAVLPASAARLSIAVTLALSGEALNDLAASVRRLSDVVPTRLVLPGPPLSKDWVKRPYWRADEAAGKALRAEAAAAWRTLGERLPACGMEIDPAFFRRYRIEDAPVFVLEAGGGTKEECGENPGTALDASRGEEAPIFIVRGNVTAGFAVAELVKGLEEEALRTPELLSLARRLKEVDLW